jgi:hypothetical protein
MTDESIDWDPEDCLCQGKVPEDKRIDYMHRIQDKNGKWVWKTYLRYHQHCPIHGCNTRIEDAPRT